MDWKSFILKIPRRWMTRKERVERAEKIMAYLRQLLEKAKHTYYSITIRNHDTLEEIKTYRLSLINFYVWSSSMLVAVALIVSGLLVFTPLKRYLPGFGGDNAQAIYALSDQIEALERKTEAQEIYHRAFRKLLLGEVESMDKIPKDFHPIPDSLITDIDPSIAELTLRQPLEQEVKSAPTGFLSTSSHNALLLPVKGNIRLDFDAQKGHYGVDIVAPQHTPIKAIAEGIIVLSDWTQKDGNSIAILHPNHCISFYKHNEKNLKKLGEKVSAGEAIATMGKTGEHIAAPHLHFEIWQNGVAVPPQTWMQF